MNIGTIQDIERVLQAVIPFLPAAAAPFGPVALALAGVIGNVIARRQADASAGPVDGEAARAVLEGMLARNAETLRVCDVITARELAHAEYLRVKLARAAASVAAAVAEGGAATRGE